MEQCNGGRGQGSFGDHIKDEGCLIIKSVRRGIGGGGVGGEWRKGEGGSLRQRQRCIQWIGFTLASTSCTVNGMSCRIYACVNTPCTTVACV